VCRIDVSGKATGSAIVLAADHTKTGHRRAALLFWDRSFLPYQIPATFLFVQICRARPL